MSLPPKKKKKKSTGVGSTGQVVQLEHLPCQALRFQQARHHLSLEGLDLCRHLHKPHPPLEHQRQSQLTIWGAAPLMDGCLLELGCHGGLVVM